MRYYDPDLGRYITPDPIGLAGGLNPYIYSGGDPVDWVDPWGLMTAGDVIRWAPIVFPIAPALPALAGTGALGTGAVIGLGIIFYPSQLGDGTLPSKGILNESIDENTDMTDPSTWPKPPVDGDCQVGEPSRKKPRGRGEKSLWDQEGGEWRPHKPDKYHPKGHWNHKPSGSNSPWIDIPVK